MKWKKAFEEPKVYGEYFCISNMGRKMKVTFHPEAKWHPQDIPMYADGEIVREWLDEQAEDWIAVDAALPEKRIRVNICLDDDLVKIGYVDHDGKWKAEDWDFEKDGSGLSKVTRWQPLPSTQQGGR